MFTGIIQGQGNLISRKKNLSEAVIATELDLSDCKIGSSISCDGICLSIISMRNENNKYYFGVNIGEETFKRSTTKYWDDNSKINLEKSLKVGDEISGHFVYGHVDTTLNTLKIEKLDSSWNYFFSTSHLNNNKKHLKFIVEKGSIAINGVSLTIAKISNYGFQISVIPHTLKLTNLFFLKEKYLVNVEFDILGKYIKSIAK